ncbi:MAG: reactive intermediate/imine deaminase [Phycisphaerae bacterium SM23_30]|nr:MAG: reactive intermediate/imine deaminase [Phycisphaerae bacterium SM23_30]
MFKQKVDTDKAPAAIGPYSQAINTGPLVFVSGQLPIDPATGSLIDGDIQEQTRQVLQNLKQVLNAAGSSLDKIVKTTVFIKDMNSFPQMNQAYAEFFPDVPPARACVEVARLPKDVQIEIEAVAIV